MIPSKTIDLDALRPRRVPQPAPGLAAAPVPGGLARRRLRRCGHRSSGFRGGGCDRRSQVPKPHFPTTAATARENKDREQPIRHGCHAFQPAKTAPPNAAGPRVAGPDPSRDCMSAISGEASRLEELGVTPHHAARDRRRWQCVVAIFLQRGDLSRREFQSSRDVADAHSPRLARGGKNASGSARRRGVGGWRVGGIQTRASIEVAAQERLILVRAWEPAAKLRGIARLGEAIAKLPFDA